MFHYTPEEIDEKHEQYSSVFNQFRRASGAPSIELMLQKKYILRLGSRNYEMFLKRIDGNIKGIPELYFTNSKDADEKGTNISVFKILYTLN